MAFPDVAVPLATYTGWNFRNPTIGQPGEILPLAGSYIPLAVTRAAREANHDPRPSIEERYPSRADYLRRVEEVANQLAAERYVLQEHVKRIVDAAGQHWDWMMAPAGSAASSK